MCRDTSHCIQFCIFDKRRRRRKIIKHLVSVSISWTAWSACSVTCGRGSQSRTAYCAGNDVTLERCYGLSQGALQNRNCNLGKCPRGDRSRVWNWRGRGCGYVLGKEGGGDERLKGKGGGEKDFTSRVLFKTILVFHYDQRQIQHWERSENMWNLIMLNYVCSVYIRTYMLLILYESVYSCVIEWLMTTLVCGIQWILLLRF